MKLIGKARTRLARQRVIKRPQPEVSGILALLMLSALLAACGQTTARSGAGPSPTPTPTPTIIPTPTAMPTPALPPARPLNWQTHTLPSSSLAKSQLMSLAVSQSDGNTAYVCAPDQQAPRDRALVWATHDQANHWSRTTDLTLDLPTGAYVGGCSLTTDTLRQNTVVAEADIYFSASGEPCHGGCFTPMDFATADGGQTWTPFAGPLPEMAALATYQQTTYATFQRVPQGVDAPSGMLEASRDGLRTWTQIAPPTTDSIGQFWLNPYDGGLLVLTERGQYNSGRLWQSADGGQTWTKLAPPPFPFDTNYIVAQQPYTKQDWLICGADPSLGNMPSPPNQPNEIACTRNGGATWSTHLLNIPAGTQIFPLLGIADDGALLLKTVVAGTTTIPPDLYRVAPGASTVASLGASPQVSGLAYPAYADGQGHGVLWLGPTGRTHDTDPQGRIFTATYS